jgi:hypothetical protein
VQVCKEVRIHGNDINTVDYMMSAAVVNDVKTSIDTVAAGGATTSSTATTGCILRWESASVPLVGEPPFRSVVSRRAGVE